MFPVSTLFLAALVFNAASSFGAPLRIPDTSSVTARSDDSSIAARAPEVPKRTVQIVSDRGTPRTSPEVEVKVREEPQLVRRYPRKVYYDHYEKREPEPEPATTVKESTVMITKLTTYDTPADAAAHAKAVGADSVTSTVFSSTQTTTLARLEVSTDTVAAPTPTTATVDTPLATPPSEPTPTTTSTESGTVTPTPVDPLATPTVTPTVTPTITPTETPTPTPSPDATPTPAAGTPSTPSGTPDHLASHNPPASPPSPEVTPKPTGLAQRDVPESLSGRELPSNGLGDASDHSAPGRDKVVKLIPRDPSNGLGDAPDHSAARRDKVVTPSDLSAVRRRDVAVTLSGRQLASSGAALASAMRRRDLSSSSSYK